MDIDLSIATLSCIFIALWIAIARFLESQTKIDMSRGYNRTINRYNKITVFLNSSVISLFFMFAVYCIYKFFQFVVTIL